MQNDGATPCRMLKLALGAGVEVDYLNAAAALIRELPAVLRVRVDLDTGGLEILHQYPADGLVQKIHLSLLLAGNELTALRAH